MFGARDVEGVWLGLSGIVCRLFEVQAQIDRSYRIVLIILIDSGY